MTAPIRVLFTHYGDEWIRGSETVLLDLLRALDKTRIQPVVWCNGDAMAGAAKAAGYPTIRSEFQYFLHYDSPPLNLPRFLDLVRTCRTLCREHDIDVLHANSAAPAQWLVPAALSARLPVLAHLHIDYLRRNRYAFLLHAAVLVIGVSRQVNDGLIADGMPPARTRVIPNGIDFARLDHASIDLRAQLGIPADAFVVATAGSLIKRKGHDILIRAFAGIATGGHARLVLASDGPERAELESLAATLGIERQVHILGYIDDITALYRAADIFALASRGDAFGLVFAEAAHFGLPAISTRVGGIPEVIVHGTTGLLVPPDDVAALADALRRLMNDAALRTRMAAAATARANEVFSIEHMTRQFEDVYATLATTPAQRLGWSRTLKDWRPYMRLLATIGQPAAQRYES